MKFAFVLLRYCNCRIPLRAGYLADLGQTHGKQELLTKQSPQRLKVLREHALIENAISSNRIEGVTVDQSRVKSVVFGKSLLRDRDDQENPWIPRCALANS